MRQILIYFCMLLGTSAAQVPFPQVPITGNIGAGGVFPLLNSGTLVFSSDANRNMAYPETSAAVIKLTSSLVLTAPRSLIAPLGLGFSFVFFNDTNGAQPINICGPSGGCATVPNDGQPHVVSTDGTNYYTPPSQTGVSSIAIATANGLQGLSSGGASPTLSIGPDGTHCIPTNTGSTSTYLNGTCGYTIPAGSSSPSGMPTVTCNPGAGAGATCSVTSASSNTGGFIIVNTGTSPSVDAVVVTITYNGAPLSNAMGGCTITPAISFASLATPFIQAFDGSNTSGWSIGDEGTSLTASTTYEWSYVCSR